jgi:sugar phosphate isomerase/epimerase
MAHRRIGYMPTGSYERLDPDGVCRSLAAIGYEAVEWTLHFASPSTHSAAELRELAATTRRHGLVASELVVQQDLVLTDPAARRATLDFIGLCMRGCADLGVDVVNLFTGPRAWIPSPLVVGASIGEGAAWDLVFAAFDELVPLAERTGVRLAVENVWGMLCHDYFTMRALVDRYRSPFLGVNYDPSHDILAGHTDIGWIISQWGASNIKHVHLKDAVGTETMGRFLFPLPGEGNVDWKAFSRALDDVGYAGCMSVEFESFAYVDRILGGDWEKAARLAFDNFSRLL